MNKFFVIESKNTPKVYFDPDSGHFEISGKSFPEHAKKFYQPVFDWFNKFEPATPGITFDLKFHYISTSSILVISELLKRLSDLEKRGCVVSTRWYYDKDDDDLRSTGEDLAELSNCRFELIPF